MDSTGILVLGYLQVPLSSQLASLSTIQRPGKFRAMPFSIQAECLSTWPAALCSLMAAVSGGWTKQPSYAPNTC